MWILYFCGGECNVIPGVRRKQRTYLCDGNNCKQPDPRDRSAGANLNRVQSMPAGIPPEAAEVLRDGLSIPSDQNPSNNQAEQRAGLCEGKDVLHQRATLDPEDIHYSQHNNCQDPDEVLRIQSDIHVAQYHRSNMPCWNVPM